ncbi:ABC transporter ATP-binding protein [Actinokineospora fastidiosa]|uniref:Iron-enterobactin transporter ATP-binding protein n=1 Tax=Actinokineospora fastidiosa TaxID=1816 RepID=A0A918GDE4_9PSEU|nr:ABC transporter ATP-binding protein [Actinokineospora fastidiosa]GGS30578.1 iron-enterobactin transporter ATP-binding protein [Actinokineospora fastidiosa]
MIRASGLRVGFGPRTVLHDVDVDVPRGQWLALVGRNGCGKTTLLRVMAGLLRPDRGTVTVDGSPLAGLSRRDIARRIAVLPQSMPDSGLTVRELVRQGRYAARGPLGMLAGGDDPAVTAALADTGTAAYADARLDRLSGGERQRARLALALAQGAPVLLLDEPTTYLDIHHQLDILDLVTRLRAERGLTVVTVLHDLAQAARYADRVIALRDGVVHADGPPAATVTPALLREVFTVEGRVWRDDRGRITCAYDGLAGNQLGV